jgi:hypothetical protein
MHVTVFLADDEAGSASKTCFLNKKWQKNYQHMHQF